MNELATIEITPKGKKGNNNNFVASSQITIYHQLSLTGIGLFTLNIETLEFNLCDRLREFMNFQTGTVAEFKDVMKCVKNKYLSVLRSSFQNAYLHKKIFECEFEVLDQNQKTKWFIAKGTFENLATDDIFHGIVTEITLIKEQENSRDEMMRMLNHELRTPLTTIKLYIQLVADTLNRSSEHKVAQLLEIADNQVDAMTQLIEDFLVLNTMNSDHLKLKTSVLEINELISEVVNVNYSRNYANNFRLESDGPIYLNADSSKITQVIHNYLSNAIKYSSIGSDITIFCKSLNDCLVVGVKDKGMGVELSDQRDLFNKFFRGSNTSVKKIKGHGIGLYLVKKIIHAHQGNVWVNSQVGKGSVFYFSIPLNGSQI